MTIYNYKSESEKKVGKYGLHNSVIKGSLLMI